MALFRRVACNKSLLFINNYYNKLTINDFKLKTCTNFLQYTVTLNFCSQHFSSNENGNLTESDQSSPYDLFFAQKKREAKRSVIIQVQSPDSYQDLYSYCHDFGAINQIQHYIVAKTSHFFVVEYEHISSQQSLLNSVTHINHNEILPVQSQMLWFRIIPKKSQKKWQDIPPMTKCTDTLTETEMTQAILSKKSISDQISCLYEISKLEDIGVRLRFLTALQMESSLTSLFPNVSVLPFGSSVNGFGRKSCDLDVVLNLEPVKKEKSMSRLVFHTKSAMSEERAQMKRSMDVIATIMQYFLPGISNVRRILHARVPIVKYDHVLTGLECDLSMTNMTAVYMTELLYLFGESDDRVRPLVFTIRKWASDVGITNVNPGPWITNFSLTLMVLFFLQHEEILPSMRQLKITARQRDIRISETCVDCTFLRDLSQWPKKTSTNTLEELLKGFFNFYANFDFSGQAISLIDASSVTKLNGSSLYILNPLENMLNVSKNVTLTEITRFVNAARNAAMLMDDRKSCVRGLLDIFMEKQSTTKRYILGRYDNKINIAELFDKNKTKRIKNNNYNNVKANNIDINIENNKEKSSNDVQEKLEKKKKLIRR